MDSTQVFRKYLDDYIELMNFINSSYLQCILSKNRENNSSIITHAPHTISLFTYGKQIEENYYTLIHLCNLHKCQ